MASLASFNTDDEILPNRVIRWSGLVVFGFVPKVLRLMVYLPLPMAHSWGFQNLLINPFASQFKTKVDCLFLDNKNVVGQDCV